MQFVGAGEHVGSGGAGEAPRRQSPGRRATTSITNARTSSQTPRAHDFGSHLPTPAFPARVRRKSRLPLASGERDQREASDSSGPPPPPAAGTAIRTALTASLARGRRLLWLLLPASSACARPTTCRSSAGPAFASTVRITANRLDLDHRLRHRLRDRPGRGGRQTPAAGTGPGRERAPSTLSRTGAGSGDAAMPASTHDAAKKSSPSTSNATASSAGPRVSAAGPSGPRPRRRSPSLPNSALTSRPQLSSLPVPLDATPPRRDRQTVRDERW